MELLWTAAVLGDNTGDDAGAADVFCRRTGIHLWPMLRRHREQRHARMRAALGDERYEQICAAGGRLGHGEAIAAVNGELDLDAAVASS